MNRFFKMEGAGNDHIYFDARNNPSLIQRLRTDVLQRLCHRRYGVGGDGIIIIGPSERAHARMWIWNADGTASDMCGNALRCIALYLSDNLKSDELMIESQSGLHRAVIRNRDLKRLMAGQVQLDMGSPIFTAESVPFLGGDSTAAGEPSRFEHGITGIEDGYVLSMGNPHCVIFVDDPDQIDVERIGDALEHHPAFPERTNVEFVNVRSDGSLYQRTWERGAGETLACGSGACAALVAAVRSGRSPARNTVHLRGGDLTIEWADSVLMTGPAALLFHGELDPREFDLFIPDSGA